MFPSIPQPMIPEALLHDMEQIKASGGRDYSKGGQWIPEESERIPFRGAIFPIDNETLRYAPAGTYTQDSRFLYTNGHALEAGAQVFDPYDGNTYTVKQDLNHGPIHPLRRYQVERKGGIKPK